MNLFKKRGIPVLCGVLYAAFVLFLSRMILRSLGDIVGGVGAAAGWEQELVSQIALAIGQLKDAKIVSNWLMGLLAGALAGGLLGMLPKRMARICVSVFAGVLMLIPCLILAVCFTEVNSILVIKLLRSVLPLLPALL